MDFVTRLERRFGWLAIPGLVRVLAVFQLMVLVLVIFMAPDAARSFVRLLELRSELVLQGEVWRVFSHLLLPVSFNPLFGIIGCLFLMWLGRSLEEQWGAFRMNLYVFGGALATALGGVLFGFQTVFPFLFPTLLFAFAVYFPNEEILLMLVIPIKVKYLAWIGAGTTLMALLRDGGLFWPILFGHLNFLVTFGRGFLQYGRERMQVAGRRARFEEATGGAAFFQKCGVCGVTDVDEPKMGFRVREDGSEICDRCREAQVS
jgi:hypothetical protein